MEKRYIGIDLHRNRFTCCIRLENERTYVTEWELENLGKFVKKLRPSDEIAVEITGNTRLFFDAVAPHVARVVVVNTNQFKVIRQSVKKTDPHDARALALYLSKNNLVLPVISTATSSLGRSFLTNFLRSSNSHSVTYVRSFSKRMQQVKRLRCKSIPIYRFSISLSW